MERKDLDPFFGFDSDRYTQDRLIGHNNFQDEFCNVWETDDGQATPNSCHGQSPDIDQLSSSEYDWESIEIDNPGSVAADSDNLYEGTHTATSCHLEDGMGRECFAPIMDEMREFPRETCKTTPYLGEDQNPGLDVNTSSSVRESQLEVHSILEYLEDDNYDKGYDKFKAEHDQKKENEDACILVHDSSMYLFDDEFFDVQLRLYPNLGYELITRTGKFAEPKTDPEESENSCSIYENEEISNIAKENNLYEVQTDIVNFWSIITSEFSCVQDPIDEKVWYAGSCFGKHKKNVDKYIKALQNSDNTKEDIFGIQNSKVEEIQNLQAKKEHFQADNCNIPQKQGTAKQQLFKSDNCNIPHEPAKAKTTLFQSDNCNEPHTVDKQVQEEDLPVQGVRSRLKEKYNNKVDISLTYLCTLFSDDFHSIPHFNNGFDTGVITVDSGMYVTGNIGGEIPIRVLMDTGATSTMVNVGVVEKHNIAEFMPVYDIQPINMQVANGQKMRITQAIKFVIELNHHLFEIIALIAPMAKDLDLIIGVKSQSEVELILDPTRLECRFKKRSIPIRLTKDINLPPGQSTNYVAKVDWIPPHNKDTDMVCKMITPSKWRKMDTVVTDLQGYYLALKLTNLGQNTLQWKQGKVLGFADFRSAGYCYLSRGALQRMLENHFVFLEEANPEEFSESCNKVEEETLPQMEPEIKDSREVKVNLEAKDLEEIPSGKSKRYDRDPYPWLDEDDERRNMSDKEIIDKYVNLLEVGIGEKEIDIFRKIMYKYREAFSLRDEIGTCPNLEVHLELKDDTPFFIRPYAITEENKKVVDKEMQRGVLLGILRKGLSSYSSPVMLIPRKLTGRPRVVSDFRVLNTRLKLLQCSTPLVRDVVQQLGVSGSEIASVVDLRDAFHSLRLAIESQKYLGITPYYGSPTYIYQRLGMGLSVSPAIFTSFVQCVLAQIPEKGHHLGIMDDILCHSRLKDHLKHLIHLFKVLIKNGLKMSPKKCQFFRLEVVYMAQYISFREGIPTITPTKEKTEAIDKIIPPTGVDGVRSLVGKVNYLSQYMKDLQLHLVPIYNLLRKNVKFEWSEECAKALHTIKELIKKPPVCICPNQTGHFTLASDTSKIATGAALYQDHKGIDRIVAYNSKRLPEAASRYSISELELLGLTINITSFKYYLMTVHFTVIIDHSALVYIWKSKKEPPTLRLKKLIEILSQYSFTMKFLKGKSMFIADFLSRWTDIDQEATDEIIPISFSLTEVLNQADKVVQTIDTFGVPMEQIAIDMTDEEQYKDFKAQHKLERAAVTTRSQRRRLGQKVKEIYPLRGSRKKPEHEVQEDFNEQGDLEVEQIPEIPEILPQENIRDKPLKDQHYFPNERMLRLPRRKRPQVTQPQIPKPTPLIPQPTPVLQPTPNPLETEDVPLAEQQKGGVEQPLMDWSKKNPLDIRFQGTLPGFDTTGESITRLPDSQFYREPRQLLEQVKNENIIRKHLPKQDEIDKFLNKLKKKAIHNYTVPITVKELTQDIKKSPYFKDIYKYIQLSQVSADIKGKALRRFKQECENYLIIETVLFRLSYKHKEDVNLLLCIPESYLPYLFYHYHDTILAGHQGITRTYLTLKERFFSPNMFECLRNYVASCHTCQSRKDKEKDKMTHHLRIPYDFRPMSRLSCDIKYMPPSTEGYKFILFVTCEVSNYVIGIPLKQANSLTIAEAMLNRIVYVFGPPQMLIFDEDKALSADVMMEINKQLQIKPIVISPHNHGSLRTERYIRTISEMLCKWLEGTGDSWHLFVNACCYAHNTFITPTIGYSPYQLVYLHQPPNLLDLDFDTFKGNTRNVKEYVDLLKKRFLVIKDQVVQRKMNDQEARLCKSNRMQPDEIVFSVGDLVYLWAPTVSTLTVPSKKFKQEWIGPVQIQAVLDSTHYVLADIQGKILPFFGSVHISRLKPCVISLGQMQGKKLATISNAKHLINELHRFEVGYA